MNEGKLILIDNLFSKSARRIAPKKLIHNGKLSKILKSRRIYCISRDSNFDGLCSSAFLIRDYGLRTKDLFFIQQAEFNSILATFRKLKPTGSAIIISDLNLNEKNFKDVERLLHYLKASNLVIWLDHHIINKKQEELLKSLVSFAVLGENETYCASELLYNLLCRKDKHNAELANIVHVTDFALKSKKYGQIADKLSYGIVSFGWNPKTQKQKLRKIALLVAKGRLNSQFLNGAYAKYLKTESKSRKALTKSLRIIDVRHKIGVGLSKRIQTNSACAEIMERCGAEIAVYLNMETGKGGIRSIGGVDCSFLANGFGGGGHPQASGFNLDPKKYDGFSKKGTEKFIRELTKIANRNSS